MQQHEDLFMGGTKAKSSTLSHYLILIIFIKDPFSR